MNSPSVLEPESCYRAMQARDARFDGRFFVGVSSTRVYCRPVCRVRLPRQQNCKFYPSAAAAESDGYRPCLKCRPELAPGHVALEANSKLAQQMALMIQFGESDQDLKKVAKRLGVTDRHARRIFHQAFGVAPIDFAQTSRLLSAKRLLTDTQLPMVDVAHAAGFRSLRRFNDLFVSRYRLQPSALRRALLPEQVSPAHLEFRLAYRPPLNWNACLAFLHLRTIAGVEAVDLRKRQYWRRLRFRGIVGELWVGQLSKQPALQVKMTQNLAPVALALLQTLRRVFDLDIDPKLIQSALGPLCKDSGLRLPGGFSGFEIAVRAVLGQQVSVKGAHTLAARLAERFGSEGCFPEALELAQASGAELCACGLTTRRAKTLIELASKIANGVLDVSPQANVPECIDGLQSVSGIGPWTAHYVAMRALRWPDALPADDLVLKNSLGLKTGKQVEAAFEAYRPWRAYAVLHTWTQSHGDK